jgi:pimeloyl-ACP methyl ester carboxylesterase
MVTVKVLILFIAVVCAGCLLITRIMARRVEARYPPLGSFLPVEGINIHYIDVPANMEPELEPMVFIHGASGNARDLMGAFGDKLHGRGRMIFVDRPGAGYSERGSVESASPVRQGRLIASLMTKLGIGRAVIVGHSLGGAITAAMAVEHPDKVAGLVFLAPATHVWPGGDVTWYYDVTNFPLLGRLFSETLAVPFGQLLYRSAVKEVFRPNRVPPDYDERSATKLILRPASFRFNARDVGALFGAVEQMSRRYGEIKAPAVIISGDSDDVVSTQIHSISLNQDIAGSRLVILPGMGHTPAYAATGRVIAEIEELNRVISARRLPVTGR